MVFLTWIPFRVRDTEHMLYSMEKFLFIDFVTDNIIQFILLYKLPVFLMITFIILHFISFRKKDLIIRISNLPLKYWIIPITLIMTLIVLFYNGNPKDFIYFKF